MSTQGQLSTETKYQILLQLQEGIPIRSLAYRFGVNQKTIKRWKQRSHTDSLQRKFGSGRKRKLNSKKEKKLEKIFDNNRSKGSKRLKGVIKNELDIAMTPRTVRNYRNRMGWVPVHPRTIPFLTMSHKKERMTFAEIYSEYAFKNVIFTDETKIDIFRNTAIVFKKNDEQRPTKEQSSSNISAMVWGGISWNGKTKLAFAQDYYENSKSRMNSAIYLEILRNRLLPFIDKKYSPGPWMLLQDNAPIHKSKLVSNFLQEKNIQTINFPPKSPDCNPIEKIWNELKRMVEEKKPKNRQELKSAIKTSWSEISVKKIRCQIQHLNKTLRKILENNGDFTN